MSGARFGHDDLPQLRGPGPKGPGAAQKVVFPHPFEGFRIMSRKLRPGRLKAFIPGHERLVVMRPQVVHVFDHEKPFGGPGDLGQRRQHAVREDVFSDPGVAADRADVGADGVQKKAARAAQASMDGAHEGAVVFMPHVFEHADGNDLVEAAFHVPVIAALDVHAQTRVRAGPAGVFDLVAGDVQARDRATVPLGRERREAPPTAADVQDLVPGRKPDLAADEVELLFLGGLQIVRALEITAAVLVVWPQPGQEHVVAQIVVFLGHDPGPSARLAVEEALQGGVEDQGRLFPGLHVQPGGAQAAKEFV